MKNLENHYLTNKPKYETGTYNRYNNSAKYSNISSSKHRNYYVSSEDEKTNSKSNNFLSDKNKTTNSKYNNKSGSKLNTNVNPFTNSQKLFNDNDYQLELKKNNKNTIPENSSHLTNHAYIYLNNIINGKNVNNFNSSIPNSVGNSLKLELTKTKNNTNNNQPFQPFIKHNSHNALNYNDNNNNTQDNINIKNNNDKFNNNFNNKHIINFSDKLIEYDSNPNKSYRGKNTNDDIIFKTNSSRRKNNEKVISNYKNYNNLNSNLNNNNIYENRKDSKEKNLSINIKKNILNKNILNINKKNVITMIPNNKTKTENNDNKKTELTKLKKIGFINLSNLSNLNDNSQKNIADKNNHSFYEVKSLSRDFQHQQTEVIISETKKTSSKIKNNNSVLNLSKRDSESNIKQNNTNNNINITNSSNKESKYNSKNNLLDKQFNLNELNKCFIKEGKKNSAQRENKKSNSDILNQPIINGINNRNIYYSTINNNSLKTNDKIIFNKDRIKLGNIQIKKQEKNNNLIKLRNDYKIMDFPNKRKNTNFESFLKFNKNKTNKINTYSFNFLPKAKNEEKKKKNKTFMSNKKLLILKNLNYKTFEEDFPLKEKKSYKRYRRYKLNKNLKPQIAVRIILFNIEKPEKERYYFVNFFYSENLRNIVSEKE